jgi:hypothetical protein
MMKITLSVLFDTTMEEVSNTKFNLYKTKEYAGTCSYSLLGNINDTEFQQPTLIVRLQGLA